MATPAQDVVVEPDDFNDNDSSLGDVSNVQPLVIPIKVILWLMVATGRDLLNRKFEQLNSRLSQRKWPHLSQVSRWESVLLITYPILKTDFKLTLEDLQHHIFDLSFDGKLGLSPPNEPGSNIGRVLDLGTGTGIWAMDFGDEHSGAEVTGVDLSPTQPQFVPPNVKFEVDDIEDTWTYSRPFDYIHSRMMNSSISKWEEYIRQSYENLTPGGWLELQEFGLPLSDDDTLKEEHALYQSMKHLGEAAAKSDHAFVDLDSLKPMLEAAGFVDVTELRFKWPSNTWPRNAKFKELGAWNYENITTGLQGFLMAALTRGLGWKADEVNVLAAQARKDVGDRSIHAYWPM
ncbi:hypothetical protein CSIM01_04300 [Colletotrichum simmondsii]|uniref:Methyltransferase domain-containing protein n=1 Tax=Colletotrichum simmondsii TaxID=703756 RepID=A0A135SAM8_9PEZI|nr:hypothetical protein CSIM01_04300 [Colletotrichum simmondsii]